MIRAPRLALVALGILASLAWTSSAPAASLPSGEREGARVLRAVEEGDRACADLSDGDFERVGEYAMGRMLGSTRAHESMDELMASMMGERAEEQMHEFMGRRFTACGGGRMPAGFGGMMGMMGMLDGSGGMLGGPGGLGGPGSGMMGDRANGFPMMGATRAGFRGDDDWGGAETAMVVMMAALLALALAVVVWLRPRGAARGSDSPLEILDRRYARGEIDAEEYRRHREALGGGA